MASPAPARARAAAPAAASRTAARAARRSRKVLIVERVQAYRLRPPRRDARPAPWAAKLRRVSVLESLGWSPFFAEAFAPFAAEGLVPGRVTREHRGLFRVQAEAGEY